MRAEALGELRDSGLADLARSLLAESHGWPDGGPVLAPRVVDDVVRDARAVLSLGDILADDSGACVLDVDGPNVSIVLQTDETVVAEGAADAFATAAGSDVSGHSFIAFASGLTLYFPSEIDIALTPSGG